MIVVDVETGGLSPKENPLLSIGAVNLKTGDEIEIEMRPRPNTVVTEQALKINGINIDQWNMKPPFFIGIRKFDDWLKAQYDGKKILVGHNPRFDLDFLQENFKEAKIPFPFGYRTIDMHTLAWIYAKRNNVPGNKFTSDEIYKMLGMEEEPRPHRAITGARMEAEAVKLILDDIPNIGNYEY